MGSSKNIELISRGLLIDKSRVLLCRNVKHNYYFLPGGHIEFGETASTALKRELIEETGLESEIGPLLLTSEHYFDDGKRVHHEMNTVFHVEHLGTGSTIPDAVPTLESKIDFHWIELATLHDIDLRPLEVKAWLMSNPKFTVDNKSTNQSADSSANSPVCNWISGFDPQIS
jgi:8-oxo-dGTP diphosphatase